MNTVSTINQFENSVTCTHPDGTRIDFCHVPSLNEIVIGETNPADDSHTQIVLNLEEAQILHQKLSSVLG